MRRLLVAVALLATACELETGRPPVPKAVAWPVDVGTLPGNQMETTVAADPNAPDRIVVASNNDGAVSPAAPAGTPTSAASAPSPSPSASASASPTVAVVKPGLLVAATGDGGRTWTHRLVARGGDGLPDACCDPRLAWDSFGNLFLSYLTLAVPDPECALGRGAVVVARSIDGGATFGAVQRLAEGCIDQPKIAAAAGSVWVAYRIGSNVVARGARVTGLGTVEAFGPETPLGGSRSGNFASVAIGPDGGVHVAYVTKTVVPGSGLQTVVRVNTDPDGLGPVPFDGGSVVSVVTLSSSELLPAQPQRGVDAQPQVAVDRSDGPARGRVYVAYVDESPVGTRVLVRSSGDGGTTWSGPLPVAPGETELDQFLPALAVDPASGRVAVTYYDTRLDTGSGPEDTDTDGVADSDADRYAAVSGEGGTTFGAPVRLSRAASNARFSGGLGMDYGDYAGTAYEAGVLVAAWADNSDSAGGNPDGRRAGLDVYVTALRPTG